MQHAGTEVLPNSANKKCKVIILTFKIYCRDR